MNNFRNDTRFAGGLGHSSVSRPGGFTPTRNFQESRAQQHNIGELEQILERERAKFKETKEKLEAELDTERKKRIQFENKLIKVKDELSRKDLSISELEFHRNNLLHKNQDLTADNERMESELQRLEEAYGGRITSLQAELEEETRLHDEEKEAYCAEYEKLKKQGQQYVESLIFEYDRKLKSVEDKLRASEGSRKELTFDNKKLNDTINQNRLSFEEELRDAINRVREEEQRNTLKTVRNFEAKVKAAQDSKEVLNRRCQEYHRLVQEKERQIEQYNNNRGDNELGLRNQIEQLNARIGQINFVCDKLKAELNERDSHLSKLKNDATYENQQLRKQVQQLRKQIDSERAAHRDTKDKQQDIVSRMEQRCKQLQERADAFEQEARKHKGTFALNSDDFQRVCQTLKSKVNQTISNVGYKPR